MVEDHLGATEELLAFAEHEARALNHGWIGVEHLLLGLLHNQRDVAARVLERAGVRIDELRAEIVRMVGPREPPPYSELAFSPGR
jgi:ATP-dependent Clp protease ATP-binding subunit ClpC